jgi:TRAP transporter 4TM/12TM fusion protein
LSLCLTFLLFPATKGALKDKLPWYDGLLALLGFAVGLYITLFHPEIVRRHYAPTNLELALGVIAVLLVLEATRRAAGWILAGMGVLFILYALYCNLLPGMLQGKGYDWDRVVPYLYLGEQGILGLALGIASSVVLAYMLFGQFLLRSGGGESISNLCLSLVGRFRGGSAKVAVIASSLFGTMSGSPVSNTVTTGTFTIPMMKGIGYRPHFAGAVEAVSSTGGILMPPVMGAAAFLMAELLGMGYAKICVGALLPAILYYVGVFSQVDLEAAKQGLRGLSPQEIPHFGKTLKHSWPLFPPMAVLIYFLLIVRFAPATAALYATGSIILVGLFSRESRFGPKRLLVAFESTGRALLDVGIICALTGIIIGAVYLTGLGVNLSIILTALAGANVSLLLVMAALASIVLGMGMPSVACYALLAILVAPALTKFGIEPLAAHLFILYFGVMSFITPPVAPAAIVAAGMAGAPFLRTGWQAMRLAVVAYLVPFMFVFRPVLIMKGTAIAITLNFFSAVMGVVLLAAALEGYLTRHLSWAGRVFTFAGGVGLLIPGWRTDIIGLGILAILLLWERRGGDRSELTRKGFIRKSLSRLMRGRVN